MTAEEFISDFFPIAILIVGAYAIISVKQQSVQMKLMLACFFLGLYAQFGGWIDNSWRGIERDYLGPGLTNLDPIENWKVTLTRIILGAGSLCAFLCVTFEQRKPSLSRRGRVTWDKWSLNLARVAGGLTLVAPLFWYISVRMDRNCDYDMCDPGGLAITFKIAILGGVLGLLATKKNYSNTTKVGLGLSDIFRDKNDQRYANFAILAIFSSLFMPYFEVLGYTISGGELLFFVFDYLVLYILESLGEIFRNDIFYQWILFPIQDLLVGVPDLGRPSGDVTSSYGYTGSIHDTSGLILDTFKEEKSIDSLIPITTLFLLLMSPLFFSLSALFAGYSLYSKGSVRENIASTHLTYFFLIIISLAFISSKYGYLIEVYSAFAMSGYLGFGFWIGGLAGFGFIRHDSNKPDSNLKYKQASNDDIYQHYFGQLIAQGYDPKIAEEYAKKYTENQLFSETLELANSEG